MRSILSALVICITALGAASNRVVVGRLGKAKAALQLYASPSGRSRVVARVSKGFPLIIRGQKNRWFNVITKSGIVGYAPAQAVQPFTYRVKASRGFFTRTPIGKAAIVAYAKHFEGTTPYRWGGEKIGVGIDCSAFVRKVFTAIHVQLPRTAAEQAKVGKPVKNLKSLIPGDRLYFWDAARGMIGHCGIYVGGGYFTHSNSTRNGITRDAFNAHWRKLCVVAMR